ncbi:uncharacterized protein LOC124175165 isoform X2 [Neodiprion fabricii]|uniref:uncharacterized protein LOC124175165 isoform X2 n=1 Tax=Neodiprion fabricii TaxID=2872261 RepID=UPI001ED8CA06|nr:uncharacterized protein LOC124175165 isoform X2 [Neodiprion fabricii]
MPYILVRGNLASYSHRYPWRVLVSGLKAADIEQLTRFASGGYCDDSTIVYLQHPCVVLTALEVLGYKVVASSSTSVKQDYNEYMWTMRKDFAEPEPEPPIKTVSGKPTWHITAKNILAHLRRYHQFDRHSLKWSLSVGSGLQLNKII